MASYARVVATRRALKGLLGRLGAAGGGSPSGLTILTYHRVGGGTDDELDVPSDQLAEQLDLLVAEGCDVLALDAALDRLDRGEPQPSVVLTFDDGFEDVHSLAWPLLRERSLPFTIYVAAGLVGGEMRWEGSTAASQGAPALTWEQLGTMQDSGLCTVGNHTWNHPRPAATDVEQLDRCTEEITRRLGTVPRHFAWTWGVEVPSLKDDVQARFRSAATGTLGRNLPGGDRHALRRVPVRRTDPLTFFRAKLNGLGPERAYAAVVSAAKAGRAAAGLVRRG